MTTNSKFSKKVCRSAYVEVGLERETLRVDEEGHLANTDHPSIFGDKLANPYISVDYSEQQIEVITPALNKGSEAYTYVQALRDIVDLEAHKKSELLWPNSMPCPMPKDDEISIAQYSDTPAGHEARAYREFLAEKYGKAQQMMSGVHYNFSFPQSLLEALYESENRSLSYREFVDECYLKVVRQYLRYAWVVVYLTGASSAFHCSVLRASCKGFTDLAIERLEGDEAVLTEGTSCRNARFGYRNATPLYPDYSSLQAYCASIANFVNRGDLSEPKELYASMRLKGSNPANPMEALRSTGVAYLELRAIDVNPLFSAGVDPKDLAFLELFVLYLLLSEEQPLPTDWQIEAERNALLAAEAGRQPNLCLQRAEECIPLVQWADEILDGIDSTACALGLDDSREVIETMRMRFQDPSQTHAYKVAELAKREGFLRSQLALARQYQEQAYGRRWLLAGFEHFEMSTQILIKEALKRGIKVEVLDAADNFIRLTQGDRVEYVKQATKTSADSYIAPLIMENKVVSKQVLTEAGIRVPRGLEFGRGEMERILAAYESIPAVVKPKSTNFGLGVTMFRDGAKLPDLIAAAELAFEHDDSVLVEEFIAGDEYRFITIGNKVAGVLFRRPANVVGDGVSTIRELVELKNQHPYRGPGYRTPLKTIELDDHTNEYLARQDLTVDSIIPEGHIVYLRPNSNISTGGDSIDMTDAIHPVFHDIALASAQAVGAAFCGVDIIVEDYSDPDSPYGVIEVNFNPAIHIHSFPAEGVERELAPDVLRTIGFTIPSD